MRVSLGLDKKILLTEDRTLRDILEITELQEPFEPRGEAMHDDVQRIRLPLIISGIRGDLGDRLKKIHEVKERSPPGLWRLPRVNKWNSWLKVEASALKTDGCTSFAGG